MQRMCKLGFRCWPFLVVLLPLPLLVTALGTMTAAGRGKTLFLLTGTYLNDAGQSFPVRLYTVDSHQRLKLFREVVSGREGLYEALDDTGENIYVAFPYTNGVSQAPTSVSVIHKRHPEQQDEVMFNPKKLLLWDRATAMASGDSMDREVLFALAPPLPPERQPSPADVPVLLRRATLASISGEVPARGPRLRSNAWDLYQHLMFYGSPGGPGVYFTPQTKIENGDLVMHLGGKTIVIDRAPKFTPAEGSPKTIWIVAANRRFLVSIPLHSGGGNYTVPATLHIHDRRDDTWREPKSAGSVPQCRIFGSWLATRVRNLKASNRGRDDNPGHSNESHEWIKYERPDVRLEYDAIDSSFYIPGIFTLDNLEESRRITLETHEEDSEILLVRKDGLVLYRVNDEIFEAKIEGDKLSAPKLVVKGEDVPEIHWVFWSRARTKPHSNTHSSSKH